MMQNENDFEEPVVDLELAPAGAEETEQQPENAPTTPAAATPAAPAAPQRNIPKIALKVPPKKVPPSPPEPKTPLPDLSKEISLAAPVTPSRPVPAAEKVQKKKKSRKEFFLVRWFHSLLTLVKLLIAWGVVCLVIAIIALISYLVWAKYSKPQHFAHLRSYAAEFCKAKPLRPRSALLSIAIRDIQDTIKDTIKEAEKEKEKRIEEQKKGSETDQDGLPEEQENSESKGKKSKKKK